MSVKAFELIPALDRTKLVVKQRSTTQVVCLECCGKNIYIGTDECTIVHFIVEESPGHNGKLCYVFKKQTTKVLLYKKPINQLKAASALNRILVLCDNVLSMLSMVDLELASTNPKIKGVNYFCVNENPVKSDAFTVEICALTRKKGLQLFSVTEDKITCTKDIVTHELPLTMGIDGSYVCVALPSQYKIINCESGCGQDLFPYSCDTFTPIVTRITREEFLLSAPGALGMFANTTGISQRPPLQWNDHLLSVIYSHPYILSLNDEFITVHSILDQKQKQSIPFQGGLLLGEFDGKIFVATAKDVYSLVPIPVEKQIEALLADKRVKEALELAKNARKIGYSKDHFYRMYQRIQQQAGFIEFADMKFEEAREHFRGGRLDVRELICLFPRMLPTTSTFRKSVPPLHEFPDITILTKGDQDKMLYYKQFLMAYLEEVRGSQDVKVAQVEVDTVLLKLYAETSSPNLVPLIASQTAVTVDDCVETLQTHGQYHALGLLYQFHHQYDNALCVWTKIVDGDHTDPTFPGLSFIVEFLANLKDHDLVWKYAEWTLQKDETLGVEIFTKRAPTEEKSDKLAPDVVVDFLGTFPKAVIAYLEYLVFQQKLQTEKFHTHLAAVYLDQVLQLISDKNTVKQDLDLARSKLRHMLQASDVYRIQLLIGKIKDSELHAELAILHGKLGEHEKALRLLVTKLRDFQAAENYCLVNSEGCHDDRKTLFHTLLQIYMDPKHDEETRSLYMEPTLSLLNNNKAEFDTIKVLKLLPDNWSVGLVSKFLTSSVRKCVNGRRTAQLESQLSRCENLEVKCQSLELTRDMVQLSDDKNCRVCKQPFVDASFVRYPNGVVAHVNCAPNKYVCPVTGKLFGTTSKTSVS